MARGTGRWGSMRTLEVYIQEVASDRLLAEVSPSVRARVQRFAAATPALLAEWIP